MTPLLHRVLRQLQFGVRATSSSITRHAGYRVCQSLCAVLLIFSLVGGEETELERLLPREPDEALRSIQTQPGFHVELVAAEPLIRDPIAIAFDENGLLYVVEFPEYNHKHAGWELNDHGRVRVLEDADRDGRYEKSTVYIDELSSPTGAICYDGGVYIAAAPDLLFCKDTDGDGRADVRRTVFTGFGISESRGGGARFNSLRWGLDNRIHLCTSFSGGNVRRADEEDSRPVDVRNRGFAFDPRTLEFEATSGDGQHGLALDDWGRFFLCNNSDPFRQIMYESRYALRNPHVDAPPSYVSIAEDGKFTKLFRVSPFEPWRVERTRRRVAGEYSGSAEGGTPAGFFTSASGVTIYRGDAWPAEYRGNIFICQPSGNLVHRATLDSDGIVLIAKRADEDSEFAASLDNWFRPVELANAPDGNLYIVDMYRELIETALALPPDVLDQMQPGGGVDRGRIYRIAVENTSRRAPPRLGDATTAELVGMLAHRNGWHRDTAARLLYERQDTAAVALIENLASDAELPEGRMTALYALSGLDALDAETVLTALEDRSDGVRVHAVRLAEHHLGTAAVRQALLRLTNDPSPHVRYQLAFTLGEISDPEVRTTALSKLLLEENTDVWMRFAVLSSLGERAGVVFQSLVEEGGARLLAERRTLLMLLARQIGAANQPDEVAAFAACLDDVAATDREMSRSLVMSLLGHESREKRDRLLAHAGELAKRILDELLADARSVGVNRNLGDQDRAAAVRALRLGTFVDDRQLFVDLLDARQPLAVQSAAVEALSHFEDNSVAKLMLEAWSHLSPQIRAQATEALCSRTAWLSLLLDAVENEQVARADVDPVRIRLLEQHPEEDVRLRVQQLFPSSETRREDVIQDYQQSLELNGDPDRGKQLFRQTCASCHKLDGVGTAVGAELSAIRDRGSSALMLNILDPNREVKPKFLNYVVLTRDGRVLTGLIAAESANSLTLKRVDGTELTIQRSDIEELRNTGLSFMPEGLEEKLDHQAMADLLEYLKVAR